tara:strand:- start:29 stop:586 length:558 start_codon:yes stop_codon:yes gene_type:complete
MENYYRVLELIDENKDNMPQGHYIEIMEKFKKTKDHIDNMADKLDDEKKEVSKKARFYDERIKKMDKDKRIQILKKQIETLKNKCDAYHVGLQECFEDENTENINNVYLDEFDKCPFTGRPLYEIIIQKKNDGLDGSIECVKNNNFVRCYCCNVKMWELGDHWTHRKDNEDRVHRLYCKDCLELM